MNYPAIAALCGLCACTTSQAEERIVPQIRLISPLDSQLREYQTYIAAHPEGGTWDKTRPLPTSWHEADLKDDATLVWIEAYFDGGTLGYLFKDSTGQYFVFCLETPLHSKRTDDGKLTPVVTPMAKRQFWMGALHRTAGAVAVPIGSATDRFLIKILDEARSKQQAPAALGAKTDIER